MSRKDLPIKRYLGDNLVFADYFNQLLKDTPVRVRPEDLQLAESRQIMSCTADRSKTGLPRRRKLRFSRRGMLVAQERDAYRTCVFSQYGSRPCMLGIEAQSVMDRTMPLRVLDYDAGSLRLLVQDIAAKRDRWPAGGGAFISGLEAGEQLPPVVTGVFAFEGEKEDWPADLHAILRFPHPGLAAFASNVRLHVLTVAELAGRPLSEFQSDLGIVARLLYHANDREYVEALLSEEDTMRKLTPNGMDVVFEYVGIDFEAHRPKEIPAMTIREKFAQMIEKEAKKEAKKEIEKEFEKGMEKGLEKGRVEGLEKGRVEGMEREKVESIAKLITMGRNLGTAKDEIVRQLMLLYPMEESQAWMKVEAVLDK